MLLGSIFQSLAFVPMKPPPDTNRQVHSEVSRMISQQFIDVFNQAADLARAGQPAQALAMYNRLSEGRVSGGDSDRVVTGEFLGVVELRRAYCLMDLERFSEARRVFESEHMQAFLTQFDYDNLYEYFFSYGNVLGNLGDVDQMDEMLSRALGIAAEHLGDLRKCESCWYYIMYWGKSAGKWQYLEEQCVGAHMFGRDNGSVFLQTKALEFGCHAYRGLGKVQKARQGAGVVLERLRGSKEKAETIAEWESFLASVAA
jgi:tetratricopeptide (TPR) repeat protein